MKYIYLGIGAYLALGLILTRTIFKGTSYRLRFRDYVLGAVFMQIICFLMFTCIISEDMWRRILIVLDFDPPEQMRAKPIERFNDDFEDLL